jgi:TfoX/Sxy family transcriptional regulator of competence genes
MGLDESTAARIRDALARKRGIQENEMFGGVGFLLNGKMLVGVRKDSLLFRLGPDESAAGAACQGFRQSRTGHDEGMDRGQP